MPLRRDFGSWDVTTEFRDAEGFPGTRPTRPLRAFDLVIVEGIAVGIAVAEGYYLPPRWRQTFQRYCEKGKW